MPKDRCKGRFSNIRKFEVLELRCEYCFDVFGFDGLDEVLTGNFGGPSVSYFLVSTMNHLEKAACFCELDIFEEEVGSDDSVGLGKGDGWFAAFGEFEEMTAVGEVERADE